MISVNNSPTTGLSSTSKKIKRTPCQCQFKEYTSPQSDEEVGKKYNTFTKSQKLLIIQDVRKALGDHSEGSPDDLINHLNSLNISEYNALIENVLALHAPSSRRRQIKMQVDLKQWRRQLKTWIKNIDKPENSKES